jgi:L-threonylcarbamoyladenylate synthase
MPRHPIAQQLITAVGQPLVAPSANLSGKPSSTTAEHVITDFEGKIQAVIDGGATEYGIESTVVSLVSDPCLLRLGAVQKAEIEAILGMPFGEATSEHKLASPGTRYRHYAPEARIKLFIYQHEMEAYLKDHLVLRRLINPKITLANLYAVLRRADEEKYDEIVLYCNPEIRLNDALMDRLQKASTR